MLYASQLCHLPSASSGHVQTVRELVRRGADTRRKMNQQTAPIDVAKEFNAPEEIRQILLDPKRADGEPDL